MSVASVPWTPASFHEALGEAAARSGITDVQLQGIVSGVRHAGRCTTFELLDLDDQGMPAAVVPVVVDAAAARHARHQLEGAEGCRAQIAGRVEADPRFGRMRVRAFDLRVDRSVHHQPHRDPADDGAAAVTGIQRRARTPARLRLVGLVTAAGSAGGEDIRELLDGVAEVATIEATAPMSGPSAPSGIDAAVRRLATRGVDLIVVARGVDLIVVARGGGPRSDLAAFDHPTTVAAIDACPVPVWVAVGHARDRTAADRVAAESFVTPSAAALELQARARGQIPEHRVALEPSVTPPALRLRIAALILIVGLVVFLALA